MPGLPELTDRNKELVKKRLSDPDRWSFAALGEHYRMRKTTAEEIFKRDLGKYATLQEIERYQQAVGIYPHS